MYVFSQTNYSLDSIELCIGSDFIIRSSILIDDPFFAIIIDATHFFCTFTEELL